jgi:hypothetical protein
VSLYGTSAVRRLNKRQVVEFEGRLYEIVKVERPTSVRGVYYVCLGLDLLDKDHGDKRPNYDKAQRRLLAMRRNGMLPYGWITDGSRPVYGHTRYRDLDEFFRQAAGQYRKEYWQNSPVQLEFWTEKDTMAGKLRPVVVDEFGLDLYVSRGFSSETYLHEAGEQIQDDGRPTFVYLLTDHDASGMSVADTVARDLPQHANGVEVTVRKIAITPEQIRKYRLITQPVTKSDSRAREFIRRYGPECAELDALPANAVRSLVRKALEQHIDPHQLHVMRLAEEEERRIYSQLLKGAR